MPATIRKTTGISSTSTPSFIVDAGAIYLNLGEVGERRLGATRGGATFEIEQEIREIEIDGTKGAVMGARRIITVRPKITAKLMELTADNIILALAGASQVGTDSEGATGVPPATHNTITRSREIALADYYVNVALVGKVQGSAENVICIIKNALADDTFSLETSDKDESVVEITFKGHFDPDLMNEEPWEIRLPIPVVTP